MLPISSSPPVEDQVPQPPTERKKGGEKKKKVVMKMFYKARLGESNDDSNDLGEDPFSNLEIVWNLTDKLAMPEMVDRMANLDHAQLIWDSLGTFLKILEAKIQAVEEFKASSEMRNLNVKFGQQTFIKGFELYEDGVARKFFELDLSFLDEKVFNEEEGPSIAAIDPSPTKVALEPFKPIIEVPEPALELEVAGNAPTSSVVTSPKSVVVLMSRMREIQKQAATGDLERGRHGIYFFEGSNIVSGYVDSSGGASDRVWWLWVP
ncbi:hypothetical protein COCNU_10G008040 [Cocos nucifera]|uniref:Uncharacterized protein n=1 Tax=Cocos nucifera TaxID=13894 RepID=A0A8K0IMD1_COCNU|nr:hypothetical protein COCNU_10G008040 [Cocos nucifera]